MEYNYTRNQARSLILSVVGHIAFFALGMYIAINMGEHLPQPKETQRKHEPARVQFQAPASEAPQPMPFGAADGQREQTNDTTMAATPSENTQSSIHAHEPLLDASTNSIDPEEISVPATGESATNADAMAAPDTSTPDALHSLSSSQSTNITDPSAAGISSKERARDNASTTASHVRPAGRRISGAQFMGAFRRSMMTEQATAHHASGSHGTGGASGGGSSGSALVQERLQEWGRADYHAKVARALIKAANIHKKYVRSPIDLNVKLYITLVLDKKEP